VGSKIAAMGIFDPSSHLSCGPELNPSNLSFW